MPKYYNADEVDATFEKLEDDYGGTSFIAGIYTAHNSIRYLPTADVEPVVHAYWMFVNGHLAPMFRCSNCRNIAFNSTYCPYCGAKMDGVTNNGKE